MIVHVSASCVNDMKMISRIIKFKNTNAENENEYFYQNYSSFLIIDHYFIEECDDWYNEYHSKVHIIFISQIINIKKMDHDIIEYRHSKDCTKKLKVGRVCDCFEIVA